MEPQDFEYVWKYFDTNNSGDISVDEFLLGIRGNLNQIRMKAVQDAYQKIDRDQSGDISLNEIEALYDVTNHPKVVRGEWSRREALIDFLQQWDGNTDGSVSREEFIDFFKDVSLGVEENRDFIETIRNIFPTLAPPRMQTPPDPLADRPGRTPDPAAEGKAGRERRRASQSPNKPSSPKKAPTPKQVREVQERAADIDMVRNITTPSTGQRPGTGGGGLVVEG